MRPVVSPACHPLAPTSGVADSAVLTSISSVLPDAQDHARIGEQDVVEAEQGAVNG